MLKNRSCQTNAHTKHLRDVHLKSKCKLSDLFLFLFVQPDSERFLALVRHSLLRPVPASKGRQEMPKYHHGHAEIHDSVRHGSNLQAFDRQKYRQAEEKSGKEQQQSGKLLVVGIVHPTSHQAGE